MKELTEKRGQLRDELDELKARYAEDQDPGTLERLSNVKRGLEKVEREIVGEVAKSPGANEPGTTPPTRTRRDTSPGAEERDAALRAVEENEASPEAKDRLDEFIRRDRSGIDSRYIAAVADEAYERGFWKRIMRPDTVAAELLPDESEAIHRVALVEQERGMSIGTPSAGGFGVPYALDPTIQLTSDGKLNPLRQLARVVTLNTSEWRGISSAGVTASWDPENTEVSDDTPVLAQPTAKAEKAAVFVPFSIEVGADYQNLQAELAKLYGDAKDQLEAEAFINGGGTANSEPQGLHVGGTATVSTAAGTAVLGGIYETQNALGPRYQPNAKWASSLTIANSTYRLVGGGNTTEPQPWNETRDVLLGKPWHEVSTMTTSGTASGGTILSYGDFASAYTIVDRIGLQAELIPHLFGTAGRPTGNRGLYGYWRVGAVVTNPNAVKSLKIS